MDGEPYELVLARPAARAIVEEIPEAIAAAVIDFVMGPLIENRVGWAERFETNWPVFTVPDTVRIECCIASTTEPARSSFSGSNTEVMCTDGDDASCSSAGSHLLGPAYRSSWSARSSATPELVVGTDNDANVLAPAASRSPLRWIVRSRGRGRHDDATCAHWTRDFAALLREALALPNGNREGLATEPIASPPNDLRTVRGLQSPPSRAWRVRLESDRSIRRRPRAL